MTYKGYTAVIEIDEDADLLFGHVIGLRDGINFQGETIREARRSFEESVDAYLRFCASRNEPPEEPFSGRFMIHVPSDLHRTLEAEATRRGEEINGLIALALSDAFPPVETPRAGRRPKAEAKPPKTGKKSAPTKRPEPEAVTATG